MARVKRAGQPRRGRQTPSRSNTEAGDEERESETKADADKGSDGKPKKRISAEEKGKGKMPMEAEKVKQEMMDIDIEEITGKAKGIVITEGGKKPEKETGKKPETTDKGKAPAYAKKGRKRTRTFAVKSSYSLRSGVDITKRREEAESDDWDVENREEVCKRIKKERKSDGDGDDSDPGGADHTNASPLGCA